MIFLDIFPVILYNNNEPANSLCNIFNPASHWAKFACHRRLTRNDGFIPKGCFMKKLLVLIMVLMLSVSSFAATSYLDPVHYVPKECPKSQFLIQFFSLNIATVVFSNIVLVAFIRSK